MKTDGAEQQAETAEELAELKRAVSRMPGDTLESMIAQALRSHAEKLDEGAELSRVGAEAPETPTQDAPDADTVSLEPTRKGYEHMRKVFADEASKARLLAQFVEAFGLRKLAERA